MRSKRQAGQASAEYALMAAVFAGTAVAATVLLRNCVEVLNQAVRYATAMPSNGI